MTQDKSRIRIALQKNGRLSDDSYDLLRQSGIRVVRDKTRLFCHSENFPLDVLWVRDDDIPQLITEGVCDFGIVGTNVLTEYNLVQQAYDHAVQFDVIRTLNFAQCRLSLAVPIDGVIQNVNDLTGMTIAASYPALLQEYLDQQQIKANITIMSGSVEIAPRLSVADAICDLVSTGATLEANHLRELAVVFQSEAVLVQGQHTLSDTQQTIVKALMQRFDGVLLAADAKYIMLHAPKKALAKITALLPGTEHPTIMHLEGQDETVALHAVCREGVFWETIEQMKALGARSILVVPIEKMIR